MAGINKVILVGIVGKIEMRATGSGMSVCNLALATSDKYKDKTTGEMVETTEWHNIVAFGKLAEILQRYVQKGKKLYIEGSLKTDKYDKNGETRYSTKVIAKDMQLLSPKDNETARPETVQQYQESSRNTPFDDSIPF